MYVFHSLGSFSEISAGKLKWFLMRVAQSARLHKTIIARNYKIANYREWERERKGGRRRLTCRRMENNGAKRERLTGYRARSGSRTARTSQRTVAGCAREQRASCQSRSDLRGGRTYVGVLSGYLGLCARRSRSPCRGLIARVSYIK